jgi:hypothetical protein
MISDQGLLYIEPAQVASAEVVLDHLTRKMTAAFRQAQPKEFSRGFHECVCGAVSTSCDYRLPNGEMTNSLCVHYLAHHRPEVPPVQLVRVGALASAGVDPRDDELQGPEFVLQRVRVTVVAWLGAERLGTWAAWGLDVEGLARSLRGGRLPAMSGSSWARGDADDLLALLCLIEPGSLPCVEAAVARDHGGMQQWGERALRVPGWSRELWVSPLVALLRHSEGRQRRSAAMRMGLLGVAGAAAVPALMDLVRQGADDRDAQYDLTLALSDLGRVLGVSLLSQLPPRPGQFGLCAYCQGTGDCYCKRKGAGSAERCPRCAGSGKCHLCRGTGRMRQ